MFDGFRCSSIPAVARARITSQTVEGCCLHDGIKLLLQPGRRDNHAILKLLKTS